jgi:diacylglycerol kinase
MTNRWSGLLDTLSRTARIDPDEYSHRTSPNRLESLGFALAGWLYMLRRQKNTRIQAAASVITLLAAFWLKLDVTGWAILILTITIVWMAEFVNAAVEAAINLSTSEYHPMAQVGKDVASAAVLLGVVASLLIGGLLLGPPLLDKLGL